MPRPNELHYTVVLRASDRISGQPTNNFLIPLPVMLPTFTNYYKVRLVQANIPLAQQTAFGLTERRYLTGGVEVLADFGGRTNSFDSNRASLQSFGFLAVPRQAYAGCLISQGQSPVHIVTNPRFQNIRIQLKDSTGAFLKSKEDGSATLYDCEEGTFVFEFSPIT